MISTDDMPTDEFFGDDDDAEPASAMGRLIDFAPTKSESRPSSPSPHAVGKGDHRSTR